MDKNFLFDLLNEINKFYPVGRPFDNENYAGYKLLKDAIENKIHEIQHNGPLKKKWGHILEGIDEIIKEGDIIDAVSQQFPNLVAIIKLPEKADSLTSFYTMIHINISLLGPYFTVFFERRMKLKEEAKLKFNPIIYGQENAPEEEIIYYNSIIKLLQKQLEYKFIDHNVLFSEKIFGICPHQIDKELIEEKYSLYRIFFGPEDFHGYKILS